MNWRKRFTTNSARCAWLSWPAPHRRAWTKALMVATPKNDGAQRAGQFAGNEAREVDDGQPHRRQHQGVGAETQAVLGDEILRNPRRPLAVGLVGAVGEGRADQAEHAEEPRQALRPAAGWAPGDGHLLVGGQQWQGVERHEGELQQLGQRIRFVVPLQPANHRHDTEGEDGDARAGQQRILPD